jgi:hydroxypyruvate isomerase
LSAEEQAAGTGLRHSACKWCYPQISIDDLCRAGKPFGLQSVELLQPAEVPLVQRHDMTCAIMLNPTAQGPDGQTIGGIPKAWNRLEYHDPLVAAYEQRIRECADLGVRNLICFSGNRDGLDDEVGLKNCAVGLKRIMPTAEKRGITISLEMLNSKTDHRDYMADHTAWAVELCHQVGSPNFRLLYDIYHMQIMEGDVIATIRQHHELFSHYHTGGVPGRGEIDDTQELNYAAIARAIAATGYRGFVGQEFVPQRDDPLESLQQAVQICSA